MSERRPLDAADRGDTPDRTNYYVLWSDSDEVIAFFRLRSESGALHGESYERGRGWIEDPRAFDVYLNGQDYELLDETEADDLVRELADGPG
jgi:hypothetical protein